MIRCLILLTLILTAEVLAQPRFDYSGYFLDLPIYQVNSDELAQFFGTDRSQFVNLSRLRVRPELSLWSRARLSADYEINSLYFSSPMIFDPGQTGKTNRQLVDLSWRLIERDNFIANHFIDRLYFRQGFNWGYAVVGRQRISWGTGRIWNPLDLFNPINPANFYKIEKDGADAVALKYYLGSFTDLNAVFNPREKLNRSNYALRFRTNIEEYDLSVLGGHFDDRLVAGFDFAGNLIGAGVRGELLYSGKEDQLRNNFIKFIVGADYQINPEIYLLFEYHFNGEGKSNKDEYELDRLASGDIINLSRYYLYSSVMYQINPLISLSLLNNHGFNDSSGFIGISGIYSITDYFDIGIGLQLFYGDRFSEFWYYSDVAYLQFQFYY